MKYEDEASVMKALEIDSWRNLSRDRVLRFAAMMPQMNTELAIRIIEQFPAFKEFALDTVKQIEEAHTSTLNANEQSQGHVYEALAEVRGILKGQLDSDELDWEQRRWIIEQIQENARLVFQKDSENKTFLDTLFGKVAMIGVGALAAGLVVLGAKVIAESADGGGQLEA